jgi:nitroimidazol reductase NimA-like FMN-containing flavoprotein (pyridoxamine 5'-phosphate oxidase superfamily)
MEPVLEHLDADECLRLISPGGVGRLAYSGRYGLTVFPVNYRMLDGCIVFRTAEYSPTGEDLRTGMPEAEYDVAFEIDSIDEAAREGWSVLIRGPAHHMDTLTEHDRAMASGVEPWVPGEREHAVRITPHRVSGRRIRRTGD